MVFLFQACKQWGKQAEARGLRGGRCSLPNAPLVLVCTSPGLGREMASQFAS